MFRKCCVPKCNSLRQDVKLHQLPAKKESRTLWLKCIGYDREVTTNMHVCHKHFEQKFINAKTNRLKCDAYPSLFTDLEISSGHPSKIPMETDSTRTISTEHSYAKKRHFDHTYLLPNNPSEEVRPEHTPNKVACLDMNVTCTPATMEYEIMAVASSSTAIQDTQGSTCKPPRKVIKRKLLRNVKSLTPRCQLLYKEYKKAKQYNYKYRARRALNFTKEKSFEDLTKNMNPLTKKVLWMQIKLCTKNKKARRFTREEKLIALSIYKQGPKCYKFLQKIFILPSKSTLKKMISQLYIDAGINPQIFEHIKQQVTGWNDKKKLCTIIYDEMAIETALTYSAHKDNIVGFVDLNGKIDQFADHALVFMLRGAVFKWQQPVAFYFCEGATSSLQLKEILKNIITAVTDTGLIPIALVSDQGSSFQSAVNSLLYDTKRDQLRAGKTVDDTIHLSGHSISVIFDPPHLIKGIRNNMLTKDMMFEGKRVSWNDIIDVYNTDCKHGESRILHKLTDQYVIPDKIKKMKVKNCVRVLSKSVSAALSYTSRFPLYPDGRPVSETMKNTAEAISFFDDLFDSVNGAMTIIKNTKGKKLRQTVTAKSDHHEFWTKSIKFLENTKFISKDRTLKVVPSIKNWIKTIKSFKRIWELLVSKNINIMRPRYFNSDIIENFFGQVRAYNYRSNDPTAYAFISTFKSLLITRFINFHSENYNCEEATSQGILNIQSLFDNVNSAPSTESAKSVSIMCQREFNVENIQAQARRERLNVHSRAYTAGWVTRKILTKIKCKQCRYNLLAEDSTTHTFIKEKEYKTKTQRKLSYPAENVVTSFTNIIKTTNEYLEQQAHQRNISKTIKQEISSKYSFVYLNCDIHKDINFTGSTCQCSVTKAGTGKVVYQRVCANELITIFKIGTGDQIGLDYFELESKQNHGMIVTARYCTNVIVPNRALAFVLTKCPLTETSALQCREYHEVTGNIICPNVVRGIDNLRDPRLNKGLAFTLEERQTLGIHGLLAAKFKTQEEQLDICRISIDRYEDNLNKYLYLVELQDRNEKLFFRLLSENIEKYLPIVYTPTVGLACQRFGLIYRRPRGLFITINDKGHIFNILKNWPEPDVRAIVFTDGERILGLGDLGAYGMGIPVGKLSLYTALAGIKPHQCLPITLDVGTDNQDLLEDPLYIGLRQHRARGKEYDEFIDEFMEACVQRYGQNTLLQFEDFALGNAARLLNKYRNKYCTFNDDIQGTASVAVAGLMAAVRVTKRKLEENIYFFLGAGSAANGIANLTVAAMVSEGLSERQARERVYMFDVDGLLSTRREGGVPEHAKNFGKDVEPEKDFEKCIAKIKPSCLIGCSTVGGAFTPTVLQQMAQNTERPVIFALSNPTSKAECTAQDAYNYTEGRCVFASGSPFPPVLYNGKEYRTGQGNNSYIFPGIGLGVIATATHHIPETMFLTAASTLANYVSEEDLAMGRIYPSLAEVKDVSVAIAIEVAKMAYDEGLASVYPEPKDLAKHVENQMYSYYYDSAMPVVWDWKPEEKFNVKPIQPVPKNI